MSSLSLSSPNNGGHIHPDRHGWCRVGLHQHCQGKLCPMLPTEVDPRTLHTLHNRLQVRVTKVKREPAHLKWNNEGTLQWQNIIFQKNHFHPFFKYFLQNPHANCLWKYGRGSKTCHWNQCRESKTCLNNNSWAPCTLHLFLWHVSDPTLVTIGMRMKMIIFKIFSLFLVVLRPYLSSCLGTVEYREDVNQYLVGGHDPLQLR